MTLLRKVGCLREFLLLGRNRVAMACQFAGLEIGGSTGLFRHHLVLWKPSEHLLEPVTSSSLIDVCLVRMQVLVNSTTET